MSELAVADDAPIVDNDDPRLQMIDGFKVLGDMNTPMDTILDQIRYAIRQGHPQVRPEQILPDRVALVGSGPTLEETLPELRALYFEGAKVVTLNRAYRWCIEHNIKPSAQVVLDAKPSSVNFVDPAVPNCLYFLASQCHPSVWARVKDRRVAIFHSANPDRPEAAILDAFYGEDQWIPILGGTTVASRAISVLRNAGYLRFELFGIDCCWIGDQHHAMEQPENQSDRRLTVRVTPSRGDGPSDAFQCAPWHIQQFEDLLQFIRVNGRHFMLSVHGRGMLAYAMRAMHAGATITTSIEPGLGETHRRSPSTEQEIER